MMACCWTLFCSKINLPVGIRIRKESSLQHLVGAGFNAGDQMGRTEGQLFHLGKIVLGVLIQNQSSDRFQWKFIMGPNFRQIKGVKFPVFSFLEGHDLDMQSVGRKVSFGDGIIEVSDGVVWIIS